MLKKHLLCDYDKKSIINFLNDYLADISIEENRPLWDSIRSFINDYGNNERKIPYCITNPGIIACMTSTHPVPEVLCSVRSKVLNQDQLLLSSKRNYFLILDGISNPDNLGIIIRTADAAGISGLILLSNSTHYLHKNAIRGGRGAIGRIPVYMSDDDNKVFSILNANHFKIIGTSARFGVSSIYEINYGYDNIAVVVGNETDGVRKEILEKCNEYAKIPMAQGQSSLNIAVASALFMYEYTRLFSNVKI